MLGAFLSCFNGPSLQQNLVKIILFGSAGMIYNWVIPSACASAYALVLLQFAYASLRNSGVSLREASYGTTLSTHVKGGSIAYCLARHVGDSLDSFEAHSLDDCAGQSHSCVEYLIDDHADRLHRYDYGLANQG